MKAWLRDISKTALQHVIPGHAFVCRLPQRAGQAVALTFDDGPDPEYTPLFLDLLEKHCVKGTFFLIGERVERNPDIARAIVSAGHEVAGHTYSHREITSLNRAELLYELYRTRQIIADTTGVDTALFRPPRGKFNSSVLMNTACAGFRMMHWSVTYSDYINDSTQALVKRYQQMSLRKQDIILFHDNNPFTLELLDIIIRDIRQSSLYFTTLSVGIQGSIKQ